MAYTRNWDESQPQDHTKLSDVPPWMRTIKIDVAQRLKDWIYGFISGETKIGLKKAPLHPVSSDPATETDKGILYVKEVDGVKELFYKDSGGNVIQLTKNGEINVSGTEFRSGDLMLSTNTDPPIGWTDISTMYDNRFIRISSETPLETGGSDTHSHTLTVDNLPPHSHDVSGLSLSIAGSHVHTLKKAASSGAEIRFDSSAFDNSASYETVNGPQNQMEYAGAHTHSISGSLGSTGSGTSFTGDNVPAYVQLRMFKKN